MIIANGNIKVYPFNGSLDNDGNPVSGRLPSRPSVYPCNYVRNSYRDNGMYEGGGTFTSSSYTILIEGDDFSPCKIYLYDLNGNELGSFNVQQKGIVVLGSVGNVQITV